MLLQGGKRRSPPPENRAALGEKTSRSPARLREQRIVQCLKFGFDLRTLEVIPDTREIGGEDRARYRQRVVCSGDGDDVVGLNDLAAERSRDLRRAPLDRQYGCAGGTATASGRCRSGDGPDPPTSLPRGREPGRRGRPPRGCSTASSGRRRRGTRPPPDRRL